MPAFKPIDRPEGEEIWFCAYQRKKDPAETKVLRKPISQIVNLNGERDLEAHEHDKKLIRGQIRDTDTKYIKLAKSGGHKNLLHFEEFENGSNSPVTYPTVEWYYHSDHIEGPERSMGKSKQEESFQPQKPDWMTHEEFEINHTVSPPHVRKRAIIGFDNMSMWKREEREKQIEEEKLKKKKISRALDGRKKKANNKQNGESGRTKNKFKLPDVSKNQHIGNSRFSGSDYATRWYTKWYVAAVSGL